MMKIFYSGSFNPWHDGHSKVALDIKRRFGVSPIIELNFSASECTGKGEVSSADVIKRFKIMPDYRRIATPFSLFTEKAVYLRQLLNIDDANKIWFACGTDTIERFDEWLSLNNGYNGHRNQEEFLAGNFGMIVYPRLKGDTINIKTEQLNHRTIFVNNFVPLEISSTEIRNANKIKTVA